MNFFEKIKRGFFGKKAILFVMLFIILAASAGYIMGGISNILNYPKEDSTEFVVGTSYNEVHKHIYKLEVEYNIKKYELISEIDSFIYKKAPSSNLYGGYIVDECIRGEYFDIILLLSQGLKESHYGTFGLANRTNSVFNVGAYDMASFDEINKNYRYSDPNNSIRPYIRLMNKKYLSHKLPSDLLNKFVDCNGKRYASYEHYERDLKKIYTDICKDTKIQSLYIEVVKYHKKLSNIY